MIPLLAMIIIPIYLPDAFAICGPEPLEQCLIVADKCLTKNAKAGIEPDLSYEWCSEEIDPALVH